MITIRHVRYFIGTAEAGQVSAAAKALNISQSAVTLALRDLEAELGVTLFYRHSTGLTLTEDGHRFRLHPDNILSAVTTAVSSMRSQTTDIKGCVKLGLSHMFSGYYIFPILARFKRQYPMIDVQLFEDDRQSIESKIKSGEVEIALLLTSNLSDRKSIDSITFVESPRRVWLPNSHPFLERENISFADLAAEPYVLLRMDEADEAARRYWQKAGVDPNVVFHTGSLEAVRTMVANGFAVTILSDIVYRPWSLDGGRIETLDIDGDVPSMNMGLAWRRGCRLHQAARTLKKHLVASA